MVQKKYFVGHLEYSIRPGNKFNFTDMYNLRKIELKIYKKY